MSDSNVFNASSIYRAILNRRSRRALINGQLNAAIKMTDLIKEFQVNPTASNLEKFAQAEKEWLNIVGGNNKAYSLDLRRALQNGGLIVISKKTINSAHNQQYDPPYGYVYGMTSVKHPNLIKLGVTSRRRHPADRLKELIEKYGISDLSIAFFCEVSYPARAEKEWTKRFHTRRALLKNHESREWFSFSQNEAQREVKKIILDLQLKEYGGWYISSLARKNPRL